MTNNQTMMARKPAQQRSRVKFEILLDATDGLLAKRDFTEIGLYDIAKAAQLPPASVYHFFPTKEAAFLALAHRYLELFRVHTERQLDAGLIRSWEDLVIQRFRNAVEFLNSHVCARKLFLSGNVANDIRRADVDHVDDVVKSSIESFNKYFYLPYLHDPHLNFTTLIAIYDGIWMVSFARHGYITDKFADEAQSAGLAYCGTFLPKVLALRPPGDNSVRTGEAK